MSYDPTTVRKTPSRNRIFSLLLIVSCGVLCSESLLVAEVRAEEFSEADVIRLAELQDPVALAAREAVAVAEADRVGAGLYANPSLGWGREQLSGNGIQGGEYEDSWFLSVPLQLSGRRRARERLAGAYVAELSARALRTQSAVVERALSIFYQVLAEQRRIGIKDRALNHLVEAARVVARRKQEGDASTYDESRIVIEMELAGSTLNETRARLSRLQNELRALLGIANVEAELTGSLAPDPGLVVGGERQPQASIELFRSAVDQAGEASEAADRAWVPNVTVSGGPRRAVAAQSRDGYVVGIQIEVPIFSNGQELRVEADARGRKGRALADAAQRASQIKQARSTQLLLSAQAEVERFGKAAGPSAANLEGAAESGYREGQRSIVELLDARRAKTSVENRQLELALTVKLAEVALRASRGDFE